MGLDLSILYRGVLSGCNYDCGYCPFAKRIDDKTVLAQDAADLARFTNWVAAKQDGRFRILFTPWGEALIRSYYQKTLCQISHMPQVARVAIQTNLSCGLGWINDVDKDTASLWCTYHPGQTTLDKFLTQCEKLERAGMSYCVGVVGTKTAINDIESLRAGLPESVYLWINAFKDEGTVYYGAEDLAHLRKIDPFFDFNLKNHESFGLPCHAGNTSISVDGRGDVRRCHFIPDIIGNLYDNQFEQSLRPAPCSRRICDCHIGYANMPGLELDDKFNGWALGRVR